MAGFRTLPDPLAEPEKATYEAADVMAVLKLARDGSNPLIVSLLVGAVIEKSATDVLAANLGGLSPAQLDRLDPAIAALPAAPSVVDGIRLDGQMSRDWLTRILEAERLCWFSRGAWCRSCFRRRQFQE